MSVQGPLIVYKFNGLKGQPVFVRIGRESNRKYRRHPRGPEHIEQYYLSYTPYDGVCLWYNIQTSYLSPFERCLNLLSSLLPLITFRTLPREPLNSSLLFSKTSKVFILTDGRRKVGGRIGSTSSSCPSVYVRLLKGRTLSRSNVYTSCSNVTVVRVRVPRFRPPGPTPLPYNFILFYSCPLLLFFSFTPHHIYHNSTILF